MAWHFADDGKREKTQVLYVSMRFYCERFFFHVMSLLFKLYDIRKAHYNSVVTYIALYKFIKFLFISY